VVAALMIKLEEIYELLHTSLVVQKMQMLGARKSPAFQAPNCSQLGSRPLDLRTLLPGAPLRIQQITRS
jgi:hypothetical protein